MHFCFDSERRQADRLRLVLTNWGLPETFESEMANERLVTDCFLAPYKYSYLLTYLLMGLGDCTFRTRDN